jgi:hypothetical protein
VAARAAEPVSPLVGQTRDQLLARYGEPRSQIERGNRVIYFYPRERVVLRDNVVVEVEEISADSVAPTSPSTPAPEAAKEPTTPSTRPATPPASGAEPRLEIKLVRPPTKDGRPPTVEPAQQPPPVARPLPAPVVPTTVPEATSTPTPPPAVPPKKITVELPPEPVERTEPVPVDEEKASDAKKAADALEDKKKKEEALRAARRRQAEAAAAEPAPSPISGQVYALAILIVAGGVGFLYWRYRQRQLDLAASSVENTPLTSTPTTPAFTGSGFTADVLNTLEWKRFEELVAAYYSKTGVVAVRTKTGPDSPVHIKISWKGEPRPFAYVQCIPHPTGLVDPKPLQALVTALAADDIRRGYVVTSGKFNVPARDFAEEKHLTLLPGDIFLEKLNALPATARTEIMQSISASDMS